VHILTSDEYSKKRLPVTSIRFCPSPAEGDTGSQRSNMLMATYTTGHVRFWHFTSSKCLQTINELRQSGQTLSSAFNPSATHLVTVGADPQIYLYDVSTKQRINSLEATDSRYKMDGHRCRVFTVQYHAAEPNVFLSGGWDDTVQFWDERARHAFRKIYGPHICGDALDIDPMHGHILTGSWRKEAPLQIWDYGSGDKIRDVPEALLNPSLLYSAQWLGKESIICGGNSKNLARVIDRSTLNSVGQLVELPQGVYCIDNDRQGSRPRVAVGAGKKIYFLRTLPGFSLQPK
jgi:WD40 repeat protein